LAGVAGHLETQKEEKLRFINGLGKQYELLKKG
jgi:hypothetical protein